MTWRASGGGGGVGRCHVGKSNVEGTTDRSIIEQAILRVKA